MLRNMLIAALFTACVSQALLGWAVYRGKLYIPASTQVAEDQIGELAAKYK